MLRVTVNGVALGSKPSCTILDLLRREGTTIPTLCDDSRLSPAGSCRLCLVRVEGFNRAVPACATPLADGMNIQTHTPELEKFRRSVLKLLLDNQPNTAVISGPETELQRYARQYGLGARVGADRQSAVIDNSHPYISVDTSRCILCSRCVRICNELQGNFVWQIGGRGKDSYLSHDGPSLIESPCVSCGACVDTCPTGALSDKSVLTDGVPERWMETVCPYCGTGCEMLVGTRDNRIVQIKPVINSTVSKGHLCVKGRYAFGYVHAADRITTPMLRDRDKEWREVSWKEAITFAASNLRRLRKEYGPDSIGVLGSARATNEEAYLTQKFARLVIGTNNVDCCARVCHAPSAAALGKMLGAGAATNSFDDIERAQTILLWGCNPTENHPVVGARIKQAVLHGAKLIVIDPRQTELAKYATIHLQLKPGTDVALANALAAVIVGEKLTDAEFIRQHVLEYAEFSKFAASQSAAEACTVTGIPWNQILSAARLYASVKPAMCFHGLGVTEHTQGTEGVQCMVNLALVTGNIGCRGAGVNPLRGQNNVQGAAHMGCDPGRLPGYLPIEAAGASFGPVWGTPIPRNPGQNLPEMIRAAESGDLRALYAIGYDILLTNPNMRATSRALSKLDLVIVQDLFLNETAKEVGTVFLPACSSFEKGGTFMNAERRVQRIRPALAPVGETRPDWCIICELAASIGHGDAFDYTSEEEIWSEVREVWPAGRGMTYSRLDEKGLQWPCYGESDPGTEILHEQGSFSSGKPAALACVPYRPSPESCSPTFPMTLATGRSLYQFNAGTMTGRTPNNDLRANDRLEIAPRDAERLRVETGDQMEVSSQYGSAILPAYVTSSVPAGLTFATFQTPALHLNTVTSPHEDNICATPEYKQTAVRLVPRKERRSPIVEERKT